MKDKFDLDTMLKEIAEDEKVAGMQPNYSASQDEIKKLVEKMKRDKKSGEN
ncbi:MAG: hypothetical protein OEZ04_10855 [Nitrospinota bacterium]|nr:hypothetical protein [Nitrospinota bacterium]